MLLNANQRRVVKCLPPPVLFKAPEVLPSETTVSEDGPPANDAAVRRELAFSSPEADKGMSSTSAGNGRARSVEPKSALKGSPSPAGRAAAEKKV